MRQLQSVLTRMGNTHALSDVLAAIEAGTMQSFVNGDTWAVTQVVEFPRGKALDIFLIVGEWNHLEDLFTQLQTYAADTGCTLMRAFGREGWRRAAEARGWRADMRVFLKDV